jgi:DNA mismatch repair protein MSH2
VLALKLRVQDGVKTVGAAFADATHRSLGVAEYAENDLFSNTEVSTGGVQGGVRLARPT